MSKVFKIEMVCHNVLDELTAEDVKQNLMEDFFADEETRHNITDVAVTEIVAETTE